MVEVRRPTLADDLGIDPEVVRIGEMEGVNPFHLQLAVETTRRNAATMSNVEFLAWAIETSERLKGGVDNG